MPNAAPAGLAGSFLGELSPAALEELLSDASLVTGERGAEVLLGGGEARAGVILEGVARVHLAGADGRQLTLRYAHPRSMVSTARMPIGNNPLTISIQAVTRLALVELSLSLLSRLEQADPTVSSALAAEATRGLAETYRQFAATVYGTIRERLAAHLLEASEERPGGSWVPVSQTELALTLGTAREVVGRALKELKSDGAVQVRRGGVSIVDGRILTSETGSWSIPSRLYAVDPARGADSFFDASPQPVIAVDRRGEILYANPRVVETFGWEPRELVGQSVTCVLPEAAGNPFTQDSHVSMARLGPSPGQRSKFKGQRRDGTEFPAEISLLPIESPGRGLVVFATVVDISYQSQILDRLAARDGLPLAGFVASAGT